LKNSSGEVSVQVSETKINFSHENMSLTSKLIDGKFPDYNRVIPSNNDKRLSVDAKAFVQCVDRVSAVSNERSRAVKLSLANDSLTFTVSNPESGSATDELGVGYNADALDIGFNARYLLDITGQLDGDMAIFELADSGSPTLIRDEQDSDALYVLMPMRV
ncbi:MAG: DNA polymerase III subunit beta, partial [Pseudomonadota bacterium]|nr:DNA polymerase III subunit beta [Pseudomonadota bacterium]